MGGRRSYTLSEAYGNTKTISKDRRKVRKSLDERDPLKIAEASSRLVIDSLKTLDLVAEVLGLLKPVVDYASKGKDEGYEERRRKARDLWRQRKVERNLTTTPAEDKFVLEAIARALKRGRP